jgi:hypothetical protein
LTISQSTLDAAAAAAAAAAVVGGESDAALEESAPRAPLVDVSRALAGGAAEKVHKRAPPAQRWLLRQQLQDVLESYMPAYAVAVEATLALEIPAGVRLEPVAVELLIGLAASAELSEAWRAYVRGLCVLFRRFGRARALRRSRPPRRRPSALTLYIHGSSSSLLLRPRPPPLFSFDRDCRRYYARILYELCQVDSFKFAGAMRAGYAVVWRCCCGSSAAAAGTDTEGEDGQRAVELCVPPPRALSFGERARLARWLAFLLSNFEFGWMWEKWASDAGLRSLGADEGGDGDAGGAGEAGDAMDVGDTAAASAPAARGAHAAHETSGTLFLRALLRRCFDLSRRDVLVAVLPRCMHRIVPNAPVTSVPYLEESASGRCVSFFCSLFLSFVSS